VVTESRQLKLGSLAPPDPEPVDLAARGEEFGFSSALRREAFMRLARWSMARARGRDAVVVQSLRAFDELQASSNRLGERLREWYGLHFPELARLVPTERYAGLASAGAPREEILQGLGLEGLPTSGSDLSQDDLKSIQSFAQAALRVRQEEQLQSEALHLVMRDVAPNLTTLVGPILGARLIESAGSLSRLARMPSSTVQLLGAERALFRHLREGKRPPKHGVLFQHPAVHTAPYWARGRIARALAGKASIAARVDAGGRSTDVGTALRSAFERRVAEILRQGVGKAHKGPPPSAARPSQRPSHRQPPGAAEQQRRGPPKPRERR
jgi:nucleolar protein 56